MARQARLGVARHGRRGKAGLGEAGQGEAGRGRRGKTPNERRREMTYQWKLPGIIPVDAQTAGEELDRIYSTEGELTPAKVVDASRPATAPLHPCFEWDDAIAAEKWRENQARAIIRNIAVTVEAGNETVDVRAFVSVDREYQPFQLVVNDENKLNSLLLAALGELRAFEAKYRILNELRPVMEAIQDVTRKGAA